MQFYFPRFIIFHVIDRDKSSSNDSLGQCIVELTNMDPERGIHGSYPLADLVCNNVK